MRDYKNVYSGSDEHCIACPRRETQDAQIERLTKALRDIVSALDTLGIDGWSEAPHLMRVCRAALEGK